MWRRHIHNHTKVIDTKVFGWYVYDQLKFFPMSFCVFIVGSVWLAFVVFYIGWFDDRYSWKHFVRLASCLWEIPKMCASFENHKTVIFYRNASGGWHTNKSKRIINHKNGELWQIFKSEFLLVSAPPLVIKLKNVLLSVSLYKICNFFKHFSSKSIKKETKEDNLKICQNTGRC